MSLRAYIFIEAEQGKTWNIAKELRVLSQVKEAHGVSGPYDVIALVETDNLRALGDLLAKKVFSIAGVKRTLSNIIVD
jgi:DNA-binding Lrp family transcriptional regulator